MLWALLTNRATWKHFFERQAATVAAARVDFFADMKHGKIRQHEKRSYGERFSQVTKQKNQSV